MTREGFESLIREQLAARDKKRRSRLHDPNVIAEADGTFVAAVMQAAGYAEPEATQETKTRARRAAKRNTEAAFGDDTSGPRR